MWAILIWLAAAPLAIPPDPARLAALEAEFMAPCCWSQTVDVHRSPASDELRAELRALVEAGLTDQQIRERVVARYGTRILVVPPATGFATTLYVLPVVLLVASGLLVLALVGRFTRAGAAPPPGPPAPPALDQRLDDELAALD
ncbi:MAG: cytochrome c-type biogenesis protein CcmH [Acidobacteriota bacterium]